MKLTIIILLLTMACLVTSDTPYCVFSFQSLSFLGNSNYFYTCSIQIDGKMTTPNEIWATHDQFSGRGHQHVTALTVKNRAKKYINSFTSVYCNTFKNLKIIDLSDVKIESVAANSFRNCKNLLLLKLYMNKFRVINDNLLINNPDLVEVHISFNQNQQLTSLPENLFANQNKLKNLELSANYFNNLPNNIFKSQENLETLKLDYNKLESLNPNWFKTLKKLKKLDLSKNYLTELPDTVFSPLISLEELNLHSNKISFIKSASFGHHPGLNDVTLNNNELFGIDKEFIEKVPIQELNMRGNTCSKDKYIARKNVDKKLAQCYEYYRLQAPEINLLQTTTTKPRQHHPISRSPTISTPSTSTATTRRTSTTKSATTTLKNWTRRTKRTTTKVPSNSLQHNCGTRAVGIPLIINGVDFNPGTYPWMAVLVTRNNAVHCGGVLISNQIVLTAGHCILTKAFIKFEPKHLRVVLGSHDLESRFEVSRIAEKIQKFHVHPHWNPMKKKFDSDIAVVVLKNKISFDDKIQPICLPKNNKIVESLTDAIVVGYGKTEDNFKLYSNIPKQATTPIHGFNQCIRDYPQLFSIASNRTTFCGGFGNGTGACTGDSGSGLFVSHNNVFYLRGLVSSSLSDTVTGCDVNKYTVYTNVTRFISWIKNVTGSEIKSRMGDDESEESEEIDLWDASVTLKPIAANETDVDSSQQNELEVEEVVENKVKATTYEEGTLWP